MPWFCLKPERVIVGELIWKEVLQIEHCLLYGLVVDEVNVVERMFGV